MKDIDELDGVDENIESPLSLLKGTSMVEPLGSCERQVYIWCLRVYSYRLQFLRFVMFHLRRQDVSLLKLRKLKRMVEERPYSYVGHLVLGPIILILMQVFDDADPEF